MAVFTVNFTPSRSYGSVRGAISDGRPYRERDVRGAVHKDTGRRSVCPRSPPDKCFQRDQIRSPSAPGSDRSWAGSFLDRDFRGVGAHFHGLCVIRPSGPSTWPLDVHSAGPLSTRFFRHDAAHLHSSERLPELRLRQEPTPHVISPPFERREARIDGVPKKRSRNVLASLLFLTARCFASASRLTRVTALNTSS